MASHLSSIGFDVRDEEGWRDLIMAAASQGAVIPTRGGRYVMWEPGVGAQLWVAIEESGAVRGMNPHFAGPSGAVVGLTERVDRSADGPFDGAFVAWVGATAEDPAQGEFPLVFDMPDARQTDALALPQLATVTLAAFAHEIKLYPTEADLRPAANNPFAAQSFVPMGMFVPGGEAIEPPQATALMYARVVDANLRTNPATGRSFHHLSVRTASDLALDVVADPSLTDSRPEPGWIVGGTFWLSGRVVSRGTSQPNAIS